MKQINLSELTFSDIFDDLPSIPQNSWVRYSPENKEFLSELKQKNRPWLVSETFFDEPSPSALAYARTRNPKGRKENYFEHKKYPDFDDDGWIVGKRESIDLDDCKYLQLERDDNLQNKLKSFYKNK